MLPRFVSDSPYLRIIFVLSLLIGIASPAARAADELHVSDFLPDDYVTDGSVSYQREFQQAIDAAVTQRKQLVVPPITFLVDENGIQLSSGLVLSMEGASFVLDNNRGQDGQVFLGRDVTDVTLCGGNIVGRNSAWPDGVNIRGVYITGNSARIRIHHMTIQDLSSNGIGMFGTEQQPIRDVIVRDVLVENCCNRYPDYLSGETWEEGSTREDQGLIALYEVEDFLVTGCRFERSRSDGTHFYRCRRGHITNNRIYRAKMGGYFLETCEEVIGSGNIMRENGSRGTTIERGSRNCIFNHNTVSTSGREGLWAPDCVGLVVQGNVFHNNGRKPNGTQPEHIWNANITINEARHDPTKSPTTDYLVTDNLIYTTSSQVAAIHVDANEATHGIVIQHNLLRGENRIILVEGAGQSEVVVRENLGMEDEPFVP